MSTEISEATRLLAPGVEITLKDGVSRRLVFDFEAICLVEEDMGSLSEFAAGLQGGWQRKRAKAIRAGMVAGLAHTGLTRAQVLKLLDFRQVESYFHAVDEAFSQGLPEPAAEDAESPNPSGELDSPGDASTTLPPSVSVAAAASSGG